jgi:hypothetical protein
MTISYRVVDITVPNRTSRKVKATLVIAPTDPAKLDGVHLENSKLLEVLAYGLTEDICAKPEAVETKEKFTLQIDAFQDILVRAVIKVQEPPKRQHAVAAFHVTDIRDRVVIGGVTIVCSSPEYPANLPAAPDPTNPCPLILAADLTCVDPGADPRSTTSKPGVIDTTKPQDIVVLVENTGPRSLTNTTVHLEHTSGSNVLTVPRVWHVGTIEPGGRFWATWEVDARTAVPGIHEATFVAQSDNYEPVRLRAKFEIRSRNW